MIFGSKNEWFNQPTEAPRAMGEAQKEDVELSQSKASDTGPPQVSNIGFISQGSLNYPYWKDQTIQIYGNFEGFLVHCLGW